MKKLKEILSKSQENSLSSIKQVMRKTKMKKSAESILSDIEELETNDHILEYFNDELDIHAPQDIADEYGVDTDDYSNDSLGLISWIDNNRDKFEEIFGEV